MDYELHKALLGNRDSKIEELERQLEQANNEIKELEARLTRTF